MPRNTNTPRGHSNAHADDTKPYSDEVSDVASIPIEGGATVYTVKPLPALALKREEWEIIGQKMNWLPSGFRHRGKPGGGALWIEFHDREGRIAVEDLTFDGIHAAKYQCTEMLEELESAQEKLDAAESREDEE